MRTAEWILVVAILCIVFAIAIGLTVWRRDARHRPSSPARHMKGTTP